jgi:hypothetical protein
VSSESIVQEGYSRNEVAFLLSLSHDEAIEHASQLQSSLGKLSEEGHQSFEPEGSDVPFIARWAEVNRARERIVKHKNDLALLQLRLQDHTEKEISVLLNMNVRTAGRRWRATLLEIMEALGGEKTATIMPLDHIDLCLKCGEQPRTRTTKRTRVWVNEKWRWKRTDRPSSMCAQCLEQQPVAA